MLLLSWIVVDAGHVVMDRGGCWSCYHGSWWLLVMLSWIVVVAGHVVMDRGGHYDADPDYAGHCDADPDDANIVMLIRTMLAL